MPKSRQRQATGQIAANAGVSYALSGLNHRNDAFFDNTEVATAGDMQSWHRLFAPGVTPG